MKLIKRIWLIGFALVGLILILTRGSMSAALGLPAENGPWIVAGGGIALIALAIAPRFLFRRG